MSSNPFVKAVIPDREPDGSGMVIVLDRIEHGVTPDYCVHGRVTCYWCDEWCWLGDKSYDLVSSGKVAAICMECGIKNIPQSSLANPVRKFNANDHRRADGPHT